MDTLNLTDKEIQQDILVYQNRIRLAQQKLSALPKNAPGSQERKRITFRRRVLEREISHVKGLIKMASEALVELQ